VDVCEEWGETPNYEQHTPLAGIVVIATIPLRTYHFRASLLLLIIINVHASGRQVYVYGRFDV